MRILVFDVPASTSGALSILKDFFSFIENQTKTLEWYFVVSADVLEQKNDNIKVLIEKFPKKNWFNRIIWEIFISNKIVKRVKPDVILSFQNTLIMFTTIPQIVYVHQSLPFMKDRNWSYLSSEERKFAIIRDLFGFLIGKSVRKANKIIVQTNWMKKALIDAYGAYSNRIVVIPPSVKTSDKKISKLEANNRDHFFYPAEPMVYKNIEIIIEATKKLIIKGYNPVVHLTINGSENTYAKRIKEEAKNMEDNFKFLGHIPREQVLELLQKYTLVFPSILETFGLPLLEARISGTCILASDRPFSREILEGYNRVQFFNPFSADELAEKMCKIMNGYYEFLDVNYSDSHDNQFPAKFNQENTWGKLLNLLEDIGGGVKGKIYNVE